MGGLSRFGAARAGAFAFLAMLLAGTAARAGTVTFRATGQVTAAGAGAAVPVGSEYALTFTLDQRPPPPATGAAALTYTREYDLAGYSARLGESESAGAGRITLVHRPYGRDRVIVRDDNGDLLLWLSGDSAASFLAGEVPSAPTLSPAVKGVSFASTLALPAASTPALVGTFELPDGVTGTVNGVTTFAPPVAPAAAVPLPSAAWGGLVLLGAVGATKLWGRRRSGEQPA